MTDTSAMTLEQIRLTGLKALSQELGLVGLVRFLQQYETGYGDYTAERHRWLGQATVQELAQEIKRQRKTTKNSTHRKLSNMRLLVGRSVMPECRYRASTWLYKMDSR